MKRILIDIDGVICAYPFTQLVKQYFGVELEADSIYAYDLADVLGVSHAALDTMFQEQVWGKPNFIEGALETLQNWYDKDYLIWIYSNRIKYMGKLQLYIWLEKYQIPFLDIDDFGGGEYDVHIDDSPAKLASTRSIKKLLYSQSYNLQCKDIFKQFIRVKSWQEIKEVV